jgi:Spy/CpxP family protein refolding chaperone
MAFRELMRKDPNGAVMTTGLELTEDEWAAIRKIDWKQSDAVLQQRISKAKDC